MSITIREVKTKSGYKEFVKFQFDLYKENKYWVPPLIKDEINALDPSKNPAYSFCKAKHWIAYKDNKPAGRISAIINSKYNQKVGKQTGRFSRLEFIQDQEVLNKLFETAENWLKQHEVDLVYGPLGFSNLDTQGLLIEGFNYLPSIASVYHLPYYKEMIEQCGYEKEIDWVEFRLTVGEKAINKASRGAQLIQKRYGIEVLHFNNTSELKPYSKLIFEILNDAFQDLPFTAPFSNEMMDYYAEKYLSVLNPEFVKMVKLKDEVIGFVVGMPSMSEAMQKAKGKLFPFGFIHLLKAKKGKTTDTMDQLLTGVLKEHQATGAGVILMAELQNAMLKHNMKYIETTGIFETNTNAISNWKNYDHIQHKRRRAFVKKLK